MTPHQISFHPRISANFKSKKNEQVPGRLSEDGHLFDGGSYIFAILSNKDRNFDTYVTIRN